MEYIEKVLLATGGHAAPEEVVDLEETEAALEKNEDDPCWSGYIQVGMKEKNGKRVPNCVPSSATIDYLMSQYNSEFGVSRHITTENSYAVARNAYEKYSEIEDADELYSAVLWELHSFAEYATTGATEDGDDFSEYSEFVSEGHPDTESSLTAAVNWVAGASELSNSAREALINAFSESTDYVNSLHASTRVRALVSSGSLSETTVSHVKMLAERYSKVN